MVDEWLKAVVSLALSLSPPKPTILNLTQLPLLLNQSSRCAPNLKMNILSVSQSNKSSQSFYHVPSTGSICSSLSLSSLNNNTPKSPADSLLSPSRSSPLLLISILQRNVKQKLSVSEPSTQIVSQWVPAQPSLLPFDCQSGSPWSQTLVKTVVQKLKQYSNWISVTMTNEIKSLLDLLIILKERLSWVGSVAQFPHQFPTLKEGWDETEDLG